MKNIIKSLILLAAGTILVSSCHKDLDIVYPMSLNSSTMWKDPSDLDKSVAGIYSRMRGFFSGSECNVFYLGEIRVGDYMWGPSLLDKVQDNFKIACRLNNLNGSQTIGWSGLYSTIDQANAVLKHCEECKASESSVKWAKGQALFARAYCYFWAARIWGYCPLNLEPVESTTQPECYPEQKTPADLYTQIGKDIAECEQYMDALGSSKYMGTKDAFNMLKAEYALWMYSTRNGGNDYLTMAETALNAIGISDSKLNSDYAATFDRTNKVNKEIVFALNNTPKSTAGYQIYFCHTANNIKKAAQCSQGGPVPISSTQWWSFSQEFVDVLKASEKAGDTRVKTNLGYGNYFSGDNTTEITWCNKLLGDMSKAPVILDNDLLYYRYAFAVMMKAELCYYKKDIQGANTALNIIAKRAYGDKKSYECTSLDALKQAITDEYFLEFPAEGVIWWALIRMDMLEKYNPSITTKKAKNPNILLWPIANGSINKNPGKIKQVEGWS